MSEKTLPLLSGPNANPDLLSRAMAQEHPTFSCMSTAMQVGDDMMFDFRIVAPEDPKVLDWLTFLFLTNSKITDLYEQVLHKALLTLLELDEAAEGIEAARMDMEEYLRERVGSYEEDDGLGLRDVEGNGAEED